MKRFNSIKDAMNAAKAKAREDEIRLHNGARPSMRSFAQEDKSKYTRKTKHKKQYV